MSREDGKPGPIVFPNLERAGRLGNQLWQIAATYAIADRFDTDPLFPDWSYRPYFSCPDHWFAERDVDLLGWRLATAFANDDIHEAQREYLQDWRLIRNHQDQIRDLFALSGDGEDVVDIHLDRTGQQWLRDVVNDYETVSLHVRRGDNADPVTHPPGTWPLVTMEYYRDALAQFRHCDVIVFSDDIPWCRQFLEHALGQKFHYVEDGPQRDPEYGVSGYTEQPALDWIDMHLMSWCTHHIIANSSYSWWGAFLGRRTVDADPTPGEGHGEYPVSVIVPDNWVGWRIPQFDFRHTIPFEEDLPGWEILPNPVAAKHLNPRARR